MEIQREWSWTMVQCEGFAYESGHPHHTMVLKLIVNILYAQGFTTFDISGKAY